MRPAWEVFGDRLEVNLRPFGKANVSSCLHLSIHKISHVVFLKCGAFGEKPKKFHDVKFKTIVLNSGQHREALESLNANMDLTSALGTSFTPAYSFR